MDFLVSFDGYFLSFSGFFNCLVVFLHRRDSLGKFVIMMGKFN